MNRAGITLVRLEVVIGEMLGRGTHHPIPWSPSPVSRLRRWTGTSDRLRPDAGRPDEVPIAIDHHPVGHQSEAIECPPGSKFLGRRHAQGVAFGRGGMTDCPGLAPPRDSIEERFPFVLGQKLRVSDLVDASISGDHRGTDRERACPRTSADLVDADDDLQPRRPQFSFERDVRRLVDQRQTGSRGTTMVTLEGYSPGFGRLVVLSEVAILVGPETWPSQASSATRSKSSPSGRPTRHNHRPVGHVHHHHHRAATESDQRRGRRGRSAPAGSRGRIHRCRGRTSSRCRNPASIAPSGPSPAAADCSRGGSKTGR